ncbi:MAG: hypothetical protein AAGJ37_04220 [Pseudomonadota bacterium]
MSALSDNFFRHKTHLKMANVALGIFTAGFCVSLIIAFGFEQHLSIWTSVFSHISTILFASMVKISYVVRLVYQKQLGQTLL